MNHEIQELSQKVTMRYAITHNIFLTHINLNSPKIICYNFHFVIFLMVVQRNLIHQENLELSRKVQRIHQENVELYKKVKTYTQTSFAWIVNQLELRSDGFHFLWFLQAYTSSTNGFIQRELAVADDESNTQIRLQLSQPDHSDYETPPRASQ